MYLETDKLQQLLSYIKENDTIIIHRHVRPDPDAFGSQLGLKYLIENAYPNKRVLAAGTMTKGLSWMGKMDDIQDSDYQDALVIVVDTANHPRIDDKRYNKGSKLVKIDHHPDVDSYGDLEMVYTEASSCSEIIANISLELNSELPLTKDAAFMLYAGIVGDTGRFMYDSTSETTLKTAAAMLKMDINHFIINDRFNTITMAQAKFQGFVLDQIKVDETGVAHILINQDDLVRYGISEEEANTSVGIPGSIEGVKTWALFIEQQGNNPYWRVRVRSKGPEINQVAAKYNGGGHPKASGASVYSKEEMNNLIEDLSKVTKEYLSNITE
ncbi:bifunctional oligoribonuclease/PAP phosphatase NrnA [Aerococcaceae bacterium DSM 111021]|nr:bifunctional oligoribonuclease/PAP phosphatase NrnA [Aerococcaceae bacterium DSM 111021]